MSKIPSPQTFLGLDIGDVRIGVARVNSIARLPEPLTVLVNDESIFENIQKIIDEQQASSVVIGLPRNLEGLETNQSEKIRDFTEKFKKNIDLPIVFVDESLSTKRAQQMIKDQNLDPNQLDALAACFILEEFIGNQES